MNQLATEWAWRQELKSPPSIVMLLCLASHSDSKTTLVSMPVRQLVKLTQCQRSTVFRQLRYLRVHGYITPIIQEAEGITPVVYRVNYLLSPAQRSRLAGNLSDAPRTRFFSWGNTHVC